MVEVKVWRLIDVAHRDVPVRHSPAPSQSRCAFTMLHTAEASTTSLAIFLMRPRIQFAFFDFITRTKIIRRSDSFDL